MFSAMMDRKSLPFLTNYDVERLMYGLGLVKYLVSITVAFKTLYSIITPFDAFEV